MREIEPKRLVTVSIRKRRFIDCLRFVVCLFAHFKRSFGSIGLPVWLCITTESRAKSCTTIYRLVPLALIIVATAKVLVFSTAKRTVSFER